MAQVFNGVCLDQRPIVQLSLVRVINGFDNFCGRSSAELRGWLKAIVTNEVHRMRRFFHTEKRNLRRETTLSEVDGNDSTFVPVDRQLTPSSQSIARERIEKFHAILEQLSDVPDGRHDL